MKMTFRWYGEQDSIPISYIRQIPLMTGVVTAVYDVPVGQVWPSDKIERLRQIANSNGLAMEVIESVPVHESIKLGDDGRDKYIDAYCHNIANLAKAGVKCICYNFMPVFDWLRTDLHTRAADGSDSLSYNHAKLMSLDVNNLHLPGWDESYTTDELGRLLDKYREIDKKKLFDNLVYFLNRIMPVCDETGIDMAIHPDDPPWDMFGLPRIITGEDGIDQLFEAVPDVHNKLTFCTGSLGAGRGNDLVHMAYKYSKANRIGFAHVRQLKFSKELDFVEAGHATDAGDLDIYNIVKSLIKGGFEGYIRPDHGRNIWGEDGKPGYGLYDRALGAAYLNGLIEAISKEGNI